MAKVGPPDTHGFALESQQRDAPDFTKASRGRIADRSSSSKAVRIAGLDKTLSLGIKAADTTIKADIRGDVAAAVDEIRDSDLTEFGTKVGKENIPPGVQRELAVAGKLAKQRKAGLKSETQLWGEAQVKLQRIKNQHPGYADIAEQVFTNAVGGRPANKLRQALLSEQREGLRLQERAQSKRDSLEKEARNSGAKFPAHISNIASEDLKRIITLKNRDDDSRARYQQTMSARKLTNTVAQQETNMRLGTIANNVVAGHIAGLGVALPGQDGKVPATLASLTKVAQNLSHESLTTGQPIDSKRRTELAQSIQVLKQNSLLAFDDEIAQPWTDDGGHSHSSQILKYSNQSTINIYRKAISDKFDDLAKAIGTNDFPLLDSHLKRMEVEQNNANLWVNSRPERIKANALRESNVLKDGYIYTINPETVTAYDAWMASDQYKNMAFNQKEGGTSFDTTLTNLGNKGYEKDHIIFKEHTDKNIATITHPEFGKEKRERTYFENTFNTKGGNFLAQFSGETKTEMWRKYTSPKMVAKVSELGRIDKRYENMYIEWVNLNFQQQLTSAVPTIKEAQENQAESGVSISWDARTNSLRVDDLPGHVGNSAVVPGGVSKTLQADNARAAVNQANTVIQGTLNVGELDKNDKSVNFTPTEAVVSTLGKLGLNVDDLGVSGDVAEKISTKEKLQRRRTRRTRRPASDAFKGLRFSDGINIKSEDIPTPEMVVDRESMQEISAQVEDMELIRTGKGVTPIVGAVGPILRGVNRVLDKAGYEYKGRRPSDNVVDLRDMTWRQMEYVMFEHKVTQMAAKAYESIASLFNEEDPTDEAQKRASKDMDTFVARTLEGLRRYEKSEDVLTQLSELEVWNPKTNQWELR